MEKKNTSATIQIVISMFIFGTIGLVRKNISMPSGCLAMTRGIVGGLMLLAFHLIKNRKGKIGLGHPAASKIWLLFISGALIGFNWIALFEAYRYTTVATATLCYYMAPVLIILTSIFIFKEKLTLKKFFCVVAAIIGMVMVSGVLTAGFSGNSEIKGVLLGLLAALLYAIIIICNKYLSDIPSYEKTIIQLVSAGVVLIPYTFVLEDLSDVSFDTRNIVFLIIICLVQTGLSYILYFGAIPKLPAMTSAILSYIDPAVAVIISATLLHEPIGATGIVGAALIIGAMVFSEINLKEKH